MRAHIDLEISHGQTQAKDEVGLLIEGVTKVGSKGTKTVIFDDFTARPGLLYPVYFTYGGHTGLRLDVPVLTDKQPVYKDYSPQRVQH